MKPGKALYFIAVVPEQPLFDRITKIKNYFAVNYNSRAALRSPPHITLLMPFQWKSAKEDQLLLALKEAVAGFESFDIKLNGFGAFPPRVIYIRVLEQPELVLLKNAVNNTALQKWNLTQVIDERPFHPHLTVAFRDLRKAQFHEAWQEFETKSFQESFTVRDLVLLKHNGKHWDIYEKFPFRS